MAAILHELFVQTDTGVAVVDRGHCILAWNPGAERLFGWPAPEITGQDIVKLLAPEGSPVRRYIGAALRGDVVQAVPVMLRQKSGDLSQLLLTCRGVVTSQDEPPSVVLFFDPTPRRQTVESTLAHRTRELQRIIGAFPDLFFWADSSGRVLDYHAGSEVDLTLPQEQFLGHRVSESFEGEAAPACRRRSRSASGSIEPSRRSTLFRPLPARATSKPGSSLSPPTTWWQSSET